ncbi:MAG: amidohydrolase [Ilumatobacter sp.]|uniref:amidohydrolase n=1 Tax=Ilumatobacter sp. TaxID=1967498 RepID=UPI00262869F6|nr:amidohydrolase [Ilumatobacter sp.]MDJ0769889.1 amidohydrolase [Ilumatobacter sp.]
MGVIYRARRVVTLDPALPRAEAVAVRDDRILGVGTIDELRANWGRLPVLDRYAGDVLLPGFVEAHAHTTEGALWAWEYVGYFPRLGPDGRMRNGCRSFESLLDVLRAVDAQLAPDESLIVWGYDPIYFPGERLAAHHLDLVSTTRSICVIHASLHLITVNTALMEREGFADGSEVEGVPVGGDGRPIGELQEPPAMSLARREMVAVFGALNSPGAISRFADMARLVGCTTVTELGAGRLLGQDDVDLWLTTAAADRFPARMVPFLNPARNPGAPDELAEHVHELRAQSTDIVRFGHVKLVLDGSIQGFTARLNPPGYLPDPEGRERPNGIWLMAPERFAELFEAFHRAHVTVHVHVNGDEAVDLLLDTAEQALADHAWLDHRHTAQHTQLTTAAQYRRMARLGMNANIFSNHIFYWGDQHRSITVGADRAARMDACATAAREGVRFSVHSDASVTPLGSLHTMWCAVNRVTASGDVLGPDERITVDRALRAVTVDAAHQLRMDHEIGTIEAGKLADFVALAEDPNDVEPMRLRDIEVRGTMVGGIATA